ncbi:protein of unknown function [Bradyrhizobium vignae]|uniref:Uncharacterized protein n=1 Tax=Bradyrhizobium vignae TaxID=1549949 RepID=A0A2U3QC16_9BRAD|nr:protein of unknown function [Bradyrhizobium vignae]
MLSLILRRPLEAVVSKDEALVQAATKKASATTSRKNWERETRPFQLEPRPVPGKIAIKQGQQLILVMAGRQSCHKGQGQAIKGTGARNERPGEEPLS